MKDAEKVFEEIFDIEINETNVLQPIEQLLDWDSFTIMEFLAEMSDRYCVDIDIMQISMIETGVDLVHLIQQCMAGTGEE